MQIHFCGVRGSTPAPGPEYVRYGGNTSCVAIARDGEAPSLVLDAGTGLRRLAGLMNGSPFDGTILIGHLHWDHTHGIPFFPAGDRHGSRVDVRIPEQGDPLEVMARVMSPPHFPVRPDELRGTWSYAGMDEGEYEIEGFHVLAREIPHKASRTFGFRVSDGTSTIAYMSDHSPIGAGPGEDGLGEYHEAVCTLADGADVLIHDAQHTAEEFPAISHFGHASIEYAVGLGTLCGVRRVVLFHHDPTRTDAALDAIVSGYADHKPIVSAAAEGIVLSLPEES